MRQVAYTEMNRISRFMPKRPYALLLASTALLLSACKEDSSVVSWLRSQFAPPEAQEMAALETFKDDPQAPYPFKTVSGSYLAGRYAQDTFDWNNAYDYLSGIIPADPSNLDLKRRTMVLAMGAGHSNEAFAMARDVIKSGDTGSLPRLFLTLETFKAGKYADVIKEIGTVPQDGISEFINPLITAWAKAGLGQADATGLSNNVVHIYHSILIADYLNNDEALKKLAQRDYTSLNLSPTSIEKIADIFARHKLTTEAQALYTYIRNSDPESAKDITEKVAKLENGTPPGGDDMKDVIKSPVDGLAQALFDMASVLYSEYEDSARLFSQMSLYLEPHGNDPRILLGHMAARNDRYEEAITYYQQIDAKDDKDLQIKIQRQIADLLEENDRTEQAVSVLTKLVDETQSIEAQIQLGDIYRHREDYKQALREYNKGFAMLDDKVPQEYWHLIYARGMTNERLKNWDEAEKDLKAALAYEPDHPYILNYLGYSWADQGVNLDKAAEMIERAVRLRPDDGYIVDSLGWVYYRMGKYQDAADTLEQAIEILPYDATINDHLGDAYWQVGRKVEARFQWKRALSFAKEQELIAAITAKIDNGIQKAGLKDLPAPVQEQAHNGKPDANPEQQPQ